MEYKTKRKIQAEETKKKIYKNSLKMIQEHGYSNITVDEICKQCNISKGTFYVHYNSKTDIILESYHTGIDNHVVSEYAIYSKQQGLSAVDKVIAFTNSVTQYADIIGLEITKFVFQFNLISESSINDNYILKLESTKVLHDIVNEGIQNGEFRTDMSAEEVVLVISIIISGVLIMWCYSPRLVTLSETIEKSLVRKIIEVLSKQN